MWSVSHKSGEEMELSLSYWLWVLERTVAIHADHQFSDEL